MEAEPPPPHDPEAGEWWTPCDVAASLRDTADRYLEARVKAQPREAGSISCRAGCFACCYQLVVVSPLEALAIEGYVAERPELAEQVAGRTAAWMERVEANPWLSYGLGEMERSSGYLSSAEGARLEFDYWRAHLPCPFLQIETGRCTIYPVRPFGCREHHVVSDPQVCADDPDAVILADTRMEYRAVATWVGENCFDLPDRVIPVPKALEFAATQPLGDITLVPIETAKRTIADAQRRVRLALAALRLRSL